MPLSWFRISAETSKKIKDCMNDEKPNANDEGHFVT